jgi:hypothetical protein
MIVFAKTGTGIRDETVGVGHENRRIEQSSQGAS